MKVQSGNMMRMVKHWRSKMGLNKLKIIENTPEEDNAANELLEKKLLELLRDDPDYVTVPPCPDELCQEFGLRLVTLNNK